jgi:hypothetical protein
MPVRLELVVADGIGGAQLVAARRCLESIGRYSDEPLELTATLRRAHAGRGSRPYRVDARLVYGGRVLAAHVSDRGLSRAAEEAALQLRRQLRRIVGTEIALRNDPRTLQRALTARPPQDWPPAGPKPAEDRRIVSRRTFADHPESTYEAISDLIDDEEHFHLFVHVRTSEDVVVHRRDHDPRIGLLHPRGSVLSDETDDVVLASPCRHADPLSLARVKEEMDLAQHRFVYFIDAGDARGKVLYRRRDGDYGLVEPG